MKTIKASRRKHIRRSLWFIALISGISPIIACENIDSLPSSVIIVAFIFCYLCTFASIFVYPLLSDYYFHNYGNEEINQDYKNKKIKECRRIYLKKTFSSIWSIYLILCPLSIFIDIILIYKIEFCSPILGFSVGVVPSIFVFCISLIISELLNKDNAEDDNASDISLTCRIENQQIPFTLDREADKSTISKDTLLELIDKGLISEVTINDVSIYGLKIGEVKCNITKGNDGLTLNYETITSDECKGIYSDKDTSSVIIY